MSDFAFRWLAQDPTKDLNTGSGNGLVPLGAKLLPEPMVTKINELTHQGYKVKCWMDGRLY